MIGFPVGNAAGFGGELDGGALGGEWSHDHGRGESHSHRLAQVQTIVPRRCRRHFIFGEGVGAAVAGPFFADLQGEGERAVIDGDGVVIFLPFFRRHFHGKTKGDDVAGFPFAIDDQIFSGGFGGDRSFRLIAPGGDSQIERKARGMLDGAVEDNSVAEGILGSFFDGDELSIANDGGYVRRRI